MNKEKVQEYQKKLSESIDIIGDRTALKNRLLEVTDNERNSEDTEESEGN